ncbi:hypothetical protein QYM36_011316 [Artemia franciscana]|uniref:Uncharacterized protein n=1 Tax=Artemia franciscana TaxID=6661 RepID=A0AA88L4P5_ARTSF|nr:hypothetical protein QYM36_011316 [Artemia franciscana]
MSCPDTGSIPFEDFFIQTIATLLFQKFKTATTLFSNFGRFKDRLRANLNNIPAEERQRIDEQMFPYEEYFNQYLKLQSIPQGQTPLLGNQDIQSCIGQRNHQ